MTLQSSRLISSSPDCWYPQMHSTDSVLHSGPSVERDRKSSWKSCETKKRRGGKVCRLRAKRERGERVTRERQIWNEKDEEESMREGERGMGKDWDGKRERAGFAVVCRISQQYQISVPSTSSLIPLFIPIESSTLLLTSVTHTVRLGFICKHCVTVMKSTLLWKHVSCVVTERLPLIQMHVSFSFSQSTGQCAWVILFRLNSLRGLLMPVAVNEACKHLLYTKSSPKTWSLFTHFDVFSKTFWLSFFCRSVEKCPCYSLPSKCWWRPRHTIPISKN